MLRRIVDRNYDHTSADFWNGRCTQQCWFTRVIVFCCFFVDVYKLYLEHLVVFLARAYYRPMVILHKWQVQTFVLQVNTSKLKSNIILCSSVVSTVYNT